jgi:signal transduction histidine kinase
MDTQYQEHTSTISIIAERLGRADIFSDLSEFDLITIAEYCVEEGYQEGDMIFSEGEPADTLLVVERGKLALEKNVHLGRHSTPRTATIGYVEPGRVAGFSALASPHIYTTSVICVDPARVIVIDGVKLRNYLQEHPDAGLKVMNILASIISDRYRHSIHTLTYFLSIVSHELRSPLAAIENYLQTMLGGYAGELNQKQLRMIKRSILRLIDMRGLIGDVVDLARMRPEQIQTDFEWFDPGEVGAESIEDVRLAAAEKNIQIIVDPPVKFEPIVGARRRMRQVFTNLLNNAIKFSPQDSTVYFRATYENENVIFKVEDQGEGIPEEELQYIFKDFYRGSNVGESPGSGLGLSIAKKIIDAHEGDISIENIKSEDYITGTRFTVQIPRELKTPEMRRRERSN